MPFFDLNEASNRTSDILNGGLGEVFSRAPDLGEAFAGRSNLGPAMESRFGLGDAGLSMYSLGDSQGGRSPLGDAGVGGFGVGEAGNIWASIARSVSDDFAAINKKRDADAQEAHDKLAQLGQAKDAVVGAVSNVVFPSGGNAAADEYLKRLGPTAYKVAQETGIPWQVLLAIPVNEQGWTADSSAPGHNLYGIKGSNPNTGANTGAVQTWEDYGNGRVNTRATFRAYTSVEESMRDFAQFLKDNPRYGTALATYGQTKDPDQLVRDIQIAGYATDPAWSTKISKIIAAFPQPQVQQSQTPDGDWLTVAKTHLGQAYVWGGTDPNTGFDCSGFVSWTLAQQGIPVRGSTFTLFPATKALDPSQADAALAGGRAVLVFYNMDSSDPHVQHVARYIGNGQVIQSGGTARSVNIASVNQAVGSAPIFRVVP